MGSTGSIGTQTLDIVEEHPELFRVSVLVAGHNWELLSRQAHKFLPRRVVIADESAYGPLKESLSGLPIEVSAGRHAVVESGEDPYTDTVVGALVGYSGLEPTIRAIKAGKTIALANKETLVVAGEIITRLVDETPGSMLIPVDSEHSAIFQCLVGEKTEEGERIILTASGGPFRTWTLEQMAHAKASDALKHPRWDMGAKVTIDSASMMNKGFEMIEAHWLFGCPPEKIEVAVHPQSIVHSMVVFRDGSLKAQLGATDMHIPIRYALGYPARLESSGRSLQLEELAQLTFERPDMKKFPLLQFAFDAIAMGGNMPCILNAANEVAVDAFLHDRITFTGMASLAEKVMASVDFVSAPTYDQLVATNAEARRRAQDLI